uniref:Chemokine interleukin-8-like domain-containing protein n=1 Tax=Denticeps clupeoides TaxID=299321 RepID=A0AAY4BPD2_9TELE
MALNTQLLLSVVLLCCLATASGEDFYYSTKFVSALITMTSNGSSCVLFPAIPGEPTTWCRCVRTTKAFIHPKNFSKVEIRDAGMGCPQKQIIITLKNKTVVCVAPEVKWINKVIERFHHCSHQVPMKTFSRATNM